MRWLAIPQPLRNRLHAPPQRLKTRPGETLIDSCGMIRVLVCGGRDFDDRAALDAALDRLHAQHRFTLLIAGGARGADTMAEQWARDRGIRTRIYMARWTIYGRAAGPIRNARMLRKGRPDLVVAFPGGKGTAGMVALARDAGVEVVVPLRNELSEAGIPYEIRIEPTGRTRAEPAFSVDQPFAKPNHVAD